MTNGPDSVLNVRGDSTFLKISAICSFNNWYRVSPSFSCLRSELSVNCLIILTVVSIPTSASNNCVSNSSNNSSSMALPRNKLTIPLPILSLVRDSPRFNLPKRLDFSVSCGSTNGFSNAATAGSLFAIKVFSVKGAFSIADSMTAASVSNLDFGSTSSGPFLGKLSESLII